MAKGNEAADGTQLAHQLASGREMILEYWGEGGDTKPQGSSEWREAEGQRKMSPRRGS